ncbi:hypothetical protein SEA_MABODAMACA_56 [Microbacterium phage Mabodamaca]|uniref:Uncharacterized protein n=1 Tax=Microbacterium phage Mabodamaca TaxID=3078574 RepID=A0AA96SDU7_9CAUD|nr:hypothetical protein SEA_MABODAMACA_56 [Microbacterium phage Mabodamaca]
MTTMTEPTFSPIEDERDPRDFLPTFPGLDELLASPAWADASIPGQAASRVLRFTGAYSDAYDGIIVLTFRDDLVDLVAVRATPGHDPLPLELDTLEPADVADWLDRWVRF